MFPKKEELNQNREKDSFVRASFDTGQKNRQTIPLLSWGESESLLEVILTQNNSSAVVAGNLSCSGRVQCRENAFSVRRGDPIALCGREGAVGGWGRWVGWHAAVGSSQGNKVGGQQNIAMICCLRRQALAWPYSTALPHNLPIVGLMGYFQQNEGYHRL